MALNLPWAFFGLFAGLWKLIVVGAAVAIFVWKKGWWRHPLFRLLRPWTSTRPVFRARPIEPKAPPTEKRRGFWGRVFGDRWYFLLFLTMVLCLLAWVLSRITIQNSIHPSL